MCCYFFLCLILLLFSLLFFRYRSFLARGVRLVCSALLRWRHLVKNMVHPGSGPVAIVGPMKGPNITVTRSLAISLIPSSLPSLMYSPREYHLRHHSKSSRRRAHRSVSAPPASAGTQPLKRPRCTDSLPIPSWSTIQWFIAILSIIGELVDASGPFVAVGEEAVVV